MWAARSCSNRARTRVVTSATGMLALRPRSSSPTAAANAPIGRRPAQTSCRQRLEHRSVGQFEYRLVAIFQRAQDRSRTLQHRASEDRVVSDLIACDQVGAAPPDWPVTSSASSGGRASVRPAEAAARSSCSLPPSTSRPATSPNTGSRSSAVSSTSATSGSRPPTAATARSSEGRPLRAD
jgi:hypothetical protein